ncbi:hypothetical protein GCM10027180_29470 [Microbulbifer echini]
MGLVECTASCLGNGGSTVGDNGDISHKSDPEREGEFLYSRSVIVYWNFFEVDRLREENGGKRGILGGYFRHKSVAV